MYENLIALVAATVLLILIPGPNVALIVANSLNQGLKAGLITALGTTAGIALQLLLVIGGMAVVIEAVSSALIWIKWLGVLYLIYVGAKTFFAQAPDLSEVRAQSELVTFWRGFFLAVINPKTLLFNAAFLPQFVEVGSEAGGQLLLVSSVFLVVVMTGDALWAVFAASARRWLGRVGRLRNKITGGFLLAAGAALALSHRNA